MKKLAVFLLATAVLCGSTVAATVFNGAVDSDFNNAANWDNGLPTNANGPGIIEAPATMSASYLMSNNAAPSVTDIIVNSTLNTGAFELQLRSGTVSRTPDVFVGDGAGNVGILNVDAGGRIDIAGAAADMLIGSNGGYGTVNFLDGSTWQMSKAVDILNGRLSVAPTVSFASTLGDELVVDNGGTLEFQIDGTTVGTITGNGGMTLELGSTSTLEINLAGTYTLGDSWTLISGIGTFAGVAGGDGTGVFGAVTSQNGFEYDITYDSTGGTLAATLVSLGTKAYSPDPALFEKDVEIDLGARTVTGKLSWNAPGDYTGATFNVYFGTTEPNDLFTDYGLDTLATGTSDTSIAPSLPLDNLKTYYWVVDAIDPNEGGTPVTYSGSHWSFTTVTAAPVIQDQPVSQLVEDGTPVTLTVDGLNFTDADVTWYHIPPGGAAGPVGPHSKTLSLTSVSVPQEGEYYAEVKNIAGSETSATVYIMTKRLVAHWAFENNLTDSVDGLTGIMRDPNTLHPDPTPNYVAGVSGQALSLLDVADPNFVYYVEVPDTNDLLDSYPLGFTLSGWMKAEPGYLYSALFGKNERPIQDGFALLQGYDGGIVLRNAGGIYIPSSGGIDMGNGQWHFVVAVYDAEAGTLAVYTDGVLVAQTNVSGNPGPIDTSLILGAMDVTEPTAPDVMRSVIWPLEGVIDELHLWSYPRDPLTIAWDYNDNRPAGTTAPCVDSLGLEYDTDGDCYIGLTDFVEIIADNWLNCREASEDCLTDPRL